MKKLKPLTSTFFFKRFVFFAPIMMLACASQEQAQDRLNQKLGAQTAIGSYGALGSKVEDTIRTSPGLTADQRSQLTDLHRRVHTEMAQIRSDSFKLRELLLADVTQTSYDPNEVDLLKQRIKDIEEKKTNLILSAADDAGKILGHANSENVKVLRAFDEFEENLR